MYLDYYVVCYMNKCFLGTKYVLQLNLKQHELMFAIFKLPMHQSVPFMNER